MIRTEIRTRIIAREQSVLNRLIAKYRSDQLAEDEARAGIAAIAELRGFLMDLDRDVRKAEEAEKQHVMAGSAQVPPQED